MCKIYLWPFLVIFLFYLKYILDLALYSQRLIISLYIISLKMFIIILLVMCLCVWMIIIWLLFVYVYIVWGLSFRLPLTHEVYAVLLSTGFLR